MNDAEQKVLVGEVQSATEILRKLHGYLSEFASDRLPAMGKNADSAFIVAGALENYYTAVETLFVRISQGFENDLPANRWHAELLHKMTITVPETRPRVILDATAAHLTELMRFRHFRRYYFGLDFDWRRLDALVAVFHDAHTALVSDLERFLDLLSDSL